MDYDQSNAAEKRRVPYPLQLFFVGMMSLILVLFVISVLDYFSKEEPKQYADAPIPESSYIVQSGGILPQPTPTAGAAEVKIR